MARLFRSLAHPTQNEMKPEFLRQAAAAGSDELESTEKNVNNKEREKKSIFSGRGYRLRKYHLSNLSVRTPSYDKKYVKA